MVKSNGNYKLTDVGKDDTTAAEDMRLQAKGDNDATAATDDANLCRYPRWLAGGVVIVFMLLVVTAIASYFATIKSLRNSQNTDSTKVGCVCHTMNNDMNVATPRRNLSGGVKHLPSVGTPLTMDAGDASLTPSRVNVTWDMCLNLSMSLNQSLPGMDCKPRQKVRVSKEDTQEEVTSQFNATSIFLPKNLKPYHYSIELKPVFYNKKPRTFYFEGSVIMYLLCVERTNVIVFHKRKLRIDPSSVLVFDLNNRFRPLKETHVSQDSRREFIQIHLVQNLTEGHRYTVLMRFSSTMTNIAHGLYWSTYKVNGETRYLVGTQLQATRARQVFPCLDEPALKATFNVTVLRRRNFTALGNMPKMAEEDRGDGWIAVKFEKTPLMSTYLVAIVVFDFSHKSQLSKSNHKIRYWAPPHIIDQVDFARDIGGRMLDFFEDMFDEPHIVPKNDMTVIPDFDAGAMENWGLITFREIRLLVDPDFSTTMDKQQVAETVAHELVHMWIGNIVTCHWWDDIWLNEGFARYFQYVGVKKVKPTWDVEHYFLMQRMHREMDGDAHALTFPVYRQVVFPRDAESMFLSAVYNKGASIIRMLVYVMGEGRFIDIVRKYIKKFAYKTVTHRDLYAIMDQYQSGTFPRSVARFFDTWTKQMAYPLVTVNTSQTEGHVTISQRIYLLRTPNTPHYHPNKKYLWDVPLSYVTDTARQWQNPHLVWLYNETAAFPLPSKPRWVVANVKQMGYFRVNYDHANWMALTSQLMEDHEAIDVINRAQLLDDAFVLARSGELDEVTSFGLTQYLVNESAFLPWYSAHNRLGQVEVMLLSRIPAFGLYRHYLIHLMQPLYDRLGWEDEPWDTVSTIYLRLNTLDHMCHVGHFGCQMESLRRLRMWMKDPANMTIIRPDLRGIVYCNAIKKGSFDEWKFVMRQFQNETQPKERRTLRDALACSQQPWVLRLYLKMSNFFMTREMPYIFEAIARNPIGLPVLWDEISSDINKSEHVNMILQVLSRFISTEEEIEKYLEMENASDMDLPQDVLDSIVRTMRQNVAWRSRNERPLVAWLENVVMGRLEGDYFSN